MLTLDQKREIARRNAQKSTGPRTQAGKNISRLNGLRHGNRAQVLDHSTALNLVLLPGEDRASYLQLCEFYCAKLGARDEVERTLIYRLAGLQWELLRFRAIRTALLEDRTQRVPVTEFPGVAPDSVALYHIASSYEAFVAAGRTNAALRQDIAATERSIRACYAELKQMRTHDPLPIPPVPMEVAPLVPQRIHTTAPAPAAGTEPELAPEPEPELAPEPEKTASPAPAQTNGRTNGIHPLPFTNYLHYQWKRPAGPAALTEAA